MEQYNRLSAEAKCRVKEDIVRRIKRGMNQRDVADETGASLRTVKYVWKEYCVGRYGRALRPRAAIAEDNGNPGTAEDYSMFVPQQPKTVQQVGRKSKLPDELWDTIIYEDTPSVWSYERIRHYIKETYNIDVFDQTVGNYLKRRGFPTLPDPRNAEPANPDDKRMRRFREWWLPLMRIESQSIHTDYAANTREVTEPSKACFVGCVPFRDGSDKFGILIYGYVANKLYFKSYPYQQCVSSTSFSDYLTCLFRTVDVPLIVVCEPLPCYRGKEIDDVMRDYFGFELVHLPEYKPGLDGDALDKAIVMSVEGKDVDDPQSYLIEQRKEHRRYLLKELDPERYEQLHNRPEKGDFDSRFRFESYWQGPDDDVDI